MAIRLVNNYCSPTPPDNVADSEGSELLRPIETGEFDVNFVFPIKELENDKLKLVPFIPHIHMPLLVEGTASHPELFRWTVFGPFTELGPAIQMWDNFIRTSPSCICFAVLDKTRPDTTGLGQGGAFAGMTGIIGASPAQSQAELAMVLYLPQFQRTHVGTHATGLLLHWLLDLPEAGGLGLRRVQWEANEQNVPSIRAAQRLGFRMEGVLRWQFVLPEGKEGLDSRKGDTAGPGRHTAMLSMCWDDWEGGVRAHVDRLMNRV